MKSGRRGRRGGRRQKRREAQAREQAAAGQGASGQAGRDAGEQDAGGATAPEARPAPSTDADRAEPSPPPAPAAAPARAGHPRPMSARELVARLEAKRLESLHSATPDTESPAAHGRVESGTGGQPDPQHATGDAHQAHHADSIALNGEGAVASRPHEPPEPRRFTVAGQEWLAYAAGRGTGGTGRVAQARLEAIRFATSAEPERVAAEVLLPGAKLDLLYDDELAELLERGLRSRTGNG